MFRFEFQQIGRRYFKQRFVQPTKKRKTSFCSIFKERRIVRCSSWSNICSTNNRCSNCLTLFRTISPSWKFFSTKTVFKSRKSNASSNFPMFFDKLLPKKKMKIFSVWNEWPNWRSKQNSTKNNNAPIGRNGRSNKPWKITRRSTSLWWSRFSIDFLNKSTICEFPSKIDGVVFRCSFAFTVTREIHSEPIAMSQFSLQFKVDFSYRDVKFQRERNLSVQWKRVARFEQIEWVFLVSFTLSSRSSGGSRDLKCNDRSFDVEKTMSSRQFSRLKMYFSAVPEDVVVVEEKSGLGKSFTMKTKSFLFLSVKNSNGESTWKKFRFIVVVVRKDFSARKRARNMFEIVKKLVRKEIFRREAAVICHRRWKDFIRKVRFLNAFAIRRTLFNGKKSTTVDRRTPNFFSPTMIRKSLKLSAFKRETLSGIRTKLVRIKEAQNKWKSQLSRRKSIFVLSKILVKRTEFLFLVSRKNLIFQISTFRTKKPWSTDWNLILTHKQNFIVTRSASEVGAKSVLKRNHRRHRESNSFCCERTFSDE